MRLRLFRPRLLFRMSLVSFERPSDSFVYTESIEPGYYVLSYLLRRLNQIHTATTVQFMYNVDTFRVEVQNDTTDQWVIDLPGPLARRLGFTSVGQDDSVRTLVTCAPNSLTVAPGQPYMGTAPVVHVAAKKIANSNLLSSNSGEYNILATVDMTQTQYGQYAVFNSFDIYLNDIDFRTPRNIGDVDFEILDHEFQPIYIDPRFHVVIQLKVYHTDTTK
jgi:hypothetical protein